MARTLRMTPCAGGLPLFVLCLAAALQCTAARAEVATLKSGLQFEGSAGAISGMGENPLNSAASEAKGARIVFLDDGLRRTFFARSQLTGPFTSGSGALVKINIRQNVAQGKNRISSVGPILKMTPFDEWGRRTVTMMGPKGPIDIIQGITEITPLYTKVEGLLSGPSYVWDMRVATSSIDRGVLSAVIRKNIDPKNSEKRLQVLRLYIQSDRYKDAQEELEGILKDFPDLTDLQKQLKALQQANANRIIKEIGTRRDAGQHELAYNMLSNFPAAGVAGETLIKVKEDLEAYNKLLEERKQILSSFEEQLKGLKDERHASRVLKVGQEIEVELSLHTLPRFAGYLRLIDDEKMPDDQKLALAISGWLLGNDSATENLAVALNLFDVRNLVRAYLNSQDEPERARILDQLNALEGSDAANLAKIVANMKPAVETPSPDPNDPQTIPGFFELSIPGLPGEADIEYCVQLPPEYNPYRRYPTIVTLGGGTAPAVQLEWWSGGFKKETGTRLGQATRRGYIVIAPKWSKPHQKKYEFSAQEHSAVLYSLRDACRRFSIDTDAVFLSGHSMGADAAWDIGLAHPDLWAGLVPIGATADRYITRYSENGRLLPMYFVQGELDGDRMSKNSQDFDRYFTYAGYELLVVEYLGRGHEHFQDEIQRIFAWMELHRRNFFPKEFKFHSMRPWDNYFWWVEVSGYPEKGMVSPAAWPPPSGTRPIESECKILANNGVVVKTGAKKFTVWLAPEMVSFEKKITVNGKLAQVKPSAKVLLEDVRTRGDRQHPFWASWEP